MSQKNIEEIQVTNKDLDNKNIIFSCAIRLEKDNSVKLCLLSNNL